MEDLGQKQYHKIKFKQNILNLLFSKLCLNMVYIGLKTLVHAVKQKENIEST